MKYVSVSVIASLLLVGCASFDIRNWNSETKAGQIVVFTGEDWLIPPTEKDALEYLTESGRCPTGYVVKEIGWRGGNGWITPAKDTEDKVSTGTSLNIGNKEVYSVKRSRGSKSGESTVIQAGSVQIESADGKMITIERSPEKRESSSGEMRGKWFDFNCK